MHEEKAPTRRYVLIDRSSAWLLSRLSGVDGVVYVEEPLGRAIHRARAGERTMYLAGGRARSVRVTRIDAC